MSDLSQMRQACAAKPKRIESHSFLCSPSPHSSFAVAGNIAVTAGSLPAAAGPATKLICTGLKRPPDPGSERVVVDVIAARVVKGARTNSRAAAAAAAVVVAAAEVQTQTTPTCENQMPTVTQVTT